jgi:hypothetical protein
VSEKLRDFRLWFKLSVTALAVLTVFGAGVTLMVTVGPWR